MALTYLSITLLPLIIADLVILETPRDGLRR